MRNTGPIIDGQKQPEGYITDYPITTISATAVQRPQNIFAKIDNLPVTATVIFELEYIRLTASITQSLEIKIRSDVTKSFKKVIYGVNSSTAADHQTQTVKFTGNNTVLLAYYQSKIPSYTNEYVRLKYKGRWSILTFTEKITGEKMECEFCNLKHLWPATSGVLRLNRVSNPFDSYVYSV